MMKTRIICVLLLVAAILPARAFNLHVIESPRNLGCNDTVLVYTPKVLAGEKNIPTLILLHGYSGCYRDWQSHMDLQELSDGTGFRIITPDGFYASWYLNQAGEGTMQWRKFFWEEFWPQIDSHYGLATDKTFISGLSMGGHGAMNIFLDYPERFRGAGSMSGVVDLKYTGGSKFLLPKLLGVETIEDCAPESAINRLERLKERCPDWADKLLVVTCGTEDKTFVGATEDFSGRCRELGLRHIAMLSPGRHTWTYWTWVVWLHLRWFGEKIEGSPLGDGR